MQEEKDPRPAEETTTDAQGSRAEEATSSETLSDVEETEKVTNTTGSSSGASESAGAGVPAPDGQFDADRTGRDEAGPM